MNWKATLAELSAERRQELGDQPSMEDLIALRAGELSEDERNRLIEYASWDPEVARELLAVIRFPEVLDSEKASGSDPDLDRRWQAMRARLLSEGILPRAQAAPEPSPEPQQDTTWSWLPIAASFALGMALTFALLELRSPAGPAAQINLPVVELVALSDTATDVRRGDGFTVVPAGTEGVVLTLAAPGLALDSGPYEIEVQHGRQEVFRSKGLVPGEGGVFVLLLPRDRLKEGAHDLLLRDASGQPVARFRLEVQLAR